MSSLLAMCRTLCPARLRRRAGGRRDAGGVPLDFTAIDFETANNSAASACSVGLVKVRDGEVVDRFAPTVKPQDMASAIEKLL